MDRSQKVVCHAIDEYADLAAEVDRLREGIDRLVYDAESRRNQPEMIDDFLALDIFERDEYVALLRIECRRLGVAL